MQCVYRVISFWGNDDTVRKDALQGTWPPSHELVAEAGMPCGALLVGRVHENTATIALLCAACHKLARCYTAHEPQSPSVFNTSCAPLTVNPCVQHVEMLLPNA